MLTYVIEEGEMVKCSAHTQNFMLIRMYNEKVQVPAHTDWYIRTFSVYIQYDIYYYKIFSRKSMQVLKYMSHQMFIKYMSPLVLFFHGLVLASYDDVSGSLVVFHSIKFAMTNSYSLGCAGTIICLGILDRDQTTIFDNTPCILIHAMN